MEAPRGVEVSAAKGPLKVSGRKDLQLESTEGEVRNIRCYAGSEKFLFRALISILFSFRSA